MKLTTAQRWSFGRHVITFAAGFLTAVAIFHVGITINSFNQLVSNLEIVAAGITTIIGLVSGVYAALSASPLYQALSLRKAVPDTTIITSPEIAAATPNDPGIVSNAQAHILAPVTLSKQNE